MTPDFQNAIQSAAALDLSDKSKEYVLFVDPCAFDIGTIEAMRDSSEFAGVSMVFMLLPPPGGSISDAVFAHPIGEYEKAIRDAERERCAKIAEEMADAQPVPNWASRVIAAKIRNRK